MTLSNLSLLTVCRCGEDVDFRRDGIERRGKVIIYRCPHCKTLGRHILYRKPQYQKVDHKLREADLISEFILLDAEIVRRKQR